MWSGCNPKNESNLNECAELGKSLNRLSQPTILYILASSPEPLHGYVIVQKMAHTPMYNGNKPDPTGIYRTLKRMESNDLVISKWRTPEEGPAKRVYQITENGKSCLRRWIDALACYALTIQDVRKEAADALGIDLPKAPHCS